MNLEETLPSGLLFSKEQYKCLNFLSGGFIIYTAGYILSTTGKFNFVVCQFFQVIGFLMILRGFIPLFKLKISNKYLETLFPIYIFWLFVIIVRGIKLDYESLKIMFTNPSFGILLYFTPLLMLLPEKLIVQKRLTDICFIFGILFLICVGILLNGLLDRYNELTQDYIETLSQISITCGFVLLTYKYHSTKKILFSILVFGLSLLFALYRARRGLTFIHVGIALCFLSVYLAHSKYTFLIFYLFVLTVLCSILYFSDNYRLANNNLLGYLLERGDEDTRTGVEIYFYNDMNLLDWIIGRGINGEYFCPGIDHNQPSDYRYLIETGYLQIILKGGIISLLLYLLIAIPAIVLGLFYSKNLLSKACAFWILVAIISLYPTTVDSFSLQYIIVWVSIGTCYSRKIRKLSDSSIERVFRKKPSEANVA